ncbi:MAG: NADH-quinone oxidoreductase subunit A [Saprospiraceae bacterium]|nr:NADH-quinone oxidoreductase subunit A [Saprospiraceae bacterium]
MSNSIDYIAILIQFLVAFGFVGIVLVTIRFAGPRRLTSDKLVNFESGIESVGNARMPFSIKYFLTAILFVLFEVEVIFMYPWAVNFKVLGMVGFVEMVLFISTLLLGFAYIIKKGALKWD